VRWTTVKLPSDYRLKGGTSLQPPTVMAGSKLWRPDDDWQHHSVVQCPGSEGAAEELSPCLTNWPTSMLGRPSGSWRWWGVPAPALRGTPAEPARPDRCCPRDAFPQSGVFADRLDGIQSIGLTTSRAASIERKKRGRCSSSLHCIRASDLGSCFGQPQLALKSQRGGQTVSNRY